MNMNEKAAADCFRTTTCACQRYQDCAKYKLNEDVDALTAAGDKRLKEKLTKVLEAVFKDLAENLENNARNCDNNDAKTALYDVAYAVTMMDMPWIVRKALEIPHGEETIELNPLHRDER